MARPQGKAQHGHRFLINFARLIGRSKDKVADEGGHRMNAIQIVHIEQDGTDGILITFSDGTIAGYVAEELIGLRPIRERLKFSPQPSHPNVPTF